MVDGKESGQYDRIGTLLFSPDSKRVAYEAEDGRVFLVVDGRVGTEYDGVHGVVFSPDSNRVAYAAGRSGKLLVVVDGQESAEYDGVGKDHADLQPR